VSFSAFWTKIERFQAPRFTPKTYIKFVDKGKMNGYDTLASYTTSDSKEAKSEAEKTVFTIRAAC
jgi:hypothetical protein